MKNIEKATNNMKMVYSILCNLKKCTIFELQKLTKFRDVDLCLALGYLLQNNQIYQKRIDNMVYYGVVAKCKDIQQVYHTFCLHACMALSNCLLYRVLRYVSRRYASMQANFACMLFFLVQMAGLLSAKNGSFFY